MMCVFNFYILCFIFKFISLYLLICSSSHHNLNINNDKPLRSKNSHHATDTTMDTTGIDEDCQWVGQLYGLRHDASQAQVCFFSSSFFFFTYTVMNHIPLHPFAIKSHRNLIPSLPNLPPMLPPFPPFPDTPSLHRSVTRHPSHCHSIIIILHCQFLSLPSFIISDLFHPY